MKTNNILEIRLEELMEKIRAEVNSRKAQQLEALGAEKDLDELAGFESERYDSSGGDTDARFVVKQQYHINDFLQYHGAAFIKNAYRGILGREADLPAYIYYWGNLKAGKMSKIEILGRLRFSAEGRAKRAHVHGLWLRFVVHLSFKIPILGYFSRLAVGVANLPTLIKNIEVNDSYVRSHLAGLQAQLSQITKSMQTNISEIKEIVADLQMKNSTSAQLDFLASNKWKINELEQSAANKADRIELKKLAAVKADRSELESFASRKADISFVDHLNDSKADRSEVQDLFSHLTDGMRQLHDFRRSLVDQERRLRILLEEVRKNVGGHTPEILIPKLEAERDHLLDALYVSFEDRFRGTSAEIKERQRIYIDYLQRSKVGSIDSPIVDIGCGRGEWLELCKENNLIVSGIDLNRSMVEELQQMGLEVIEEDFVSYLRDKNPNTFGGITVFHLIEHLTLENLIILLDEALRVLKPNGILIVETPNPDNIIVGSRSFYIDPTHVKPIPSPTLQYLVEARGYVNIEILNLNPVPEYEREEGITGKLCELLYGARDYSLIGYKP